MARFSSIALTLVVLLAGCTLANNPPRDQHTYVVRYTASGTLDTLPTLTYLDAAGAPVVVNPASLPWTTEFTMDYDFGNDPAAALFTPSLQAVPTWGTGTLTLTISWEDYKTLFTEEILAQETESQVTAPASFTIYGPPSPKCRVGVRVR